MFHVKPFYLEQGKPMKTIYNLGSC